MPASVPIRGLRDDRPRYYRLDDAVLGSRPGEVRAVLDWEITLGDPLADVGLLMVYWTEPEDEAAVLGAVSLRPSSRIPLQGPIGLSTNRPPGRDLLRSFDFFVAFGY